MLAVALLALLSCADTGQRPPRQLVVAAFTAPKRVYEEALFPAFRARWEAQTGEQVELVGSFRGSGAQTRALLAGYPADVAALALEPDLDRLAEAGLIQHDWRAAEHGGMVSRSLVALAVRPGNPKGIAGWDDLSCPDLTVLTPDPANSGGAQWNLAALVGAVQRAGAFAPGTDSAVCEALLAAVLAHVPAMDAGARESMLRFEKGEGDVAITYESEVLAARAAGQRCDLLLPPATLLVEHPAAVLDRNVDAHATRDLAEAFLRFLHGPEAQRAFAEHGFRPADEGRAGRARGGLPRPARTVLRARSRRLGRPAQGSLRSRRALRARVRPGGTGRRPGALTSSRVGLQPAVQRSWISASALPRAMPGSVTITPKTKALGVAEASQVNST